jgi:selenocysteine lyase/cysteine desulfurase
MTLDILKIRADFPVLDQQVNGSSLIYFDNAATTQKPKSVIDALSHYYKSDNANIHSKFNYFTMDTPVFDRVSALPENINNNNNINSITSYGIEVPDPPGESKSK